jgi:hypothetical protein
MLVLAPMLCLVVLRSMDESCEQWRSYLRKVVVDASVSCLPLFSFPAMK